jgi:SAM-dependent methyltransferase
VTEELDAVVAHNRLAWDREVGSGNEWTVPVGPEVIAAARAGEWSVVLIGHEPVPADWIPASLRDVDVLCVASGGGQQGPVLAAAGARVTVLDNSPSQLAQDQLVATREGLSLRTVLGDMRDLSAIGDATFDLVFQPVSNVFCPELEPVWRAAHRVLRPGGTLLAGFMNPDIFIFDADASQNRGELVVRHSLPYSDIADLEPAERERLWGAHAPLEYSHTLTAQIGGQLAAGFVITGFSELPHHDDATAAFMPGYFATRAWKAPSGWSTASR